MAGLRRGTGIAPCGVSTLQLGVPSAPVASERIATSLTHGPYPWPTIPPNTIILSWDSSYTLRWPQRPLNDTPCGANWVQTGLPFPFALLSRHTSEIGGADAGSIPDPP